MALIERKTSMYLLIQIAFWRVEWSQILLTVSGFLCSLTILKFAFFRMLIREGIFVFQRNTPLAALFQKRNKTLRIFKANL